MNHIINQLFNSVAVLVLCGLYACGLNSRNQAADRGELCTSDSISADCASVNSKVLSFTGRRPLAVKHGDTVVLTGTGFNNAMTATVGGIPVTSLDVTSVTSASLVVPSGAATGMSELTLNLNAAQATASIAYRPADGIPLMTVASAEVCAGVDFYDANGDMQSGTKSCSGTNTPECFADGAVGCIATTRFKAADTSLFSGGDIRITKTVAGVAGSIPDAPSVCTANGQGSCLVDGTSYKSADFSNLVASNIKSGVSIAGVSGNVTESPANCGVNGQQSCVAAGSYFAGTACGVDGSSCFLPLYAAGTQNKKAIDFSMIDAAKIRTSLTISGVTGSVADCSGNAETDCVTTASYKSADFSNLVASNIKSGVSIAGVSGNVTESPANCGVNGQQSCVAAGSYFAGTACGVDGSSCFLPLYAAGTQNKKAIDFSMIDAAKIRTSLTISGVTGSVADCSGNAETDCVTTASYKSADFSNLVASNIKSGASVAGVVGQYPSATYTLTGSSGTSDLDEATFDARLKSATAFEWFGPDGVRYTGAGDADLSSAASIASGVTIFGMTGTLVSSSPPNAWDLRAGAVVSGVTGKLKVNCRNAVRLSGTGSYDNQTSPAAAGSDIWDTIGDAYGLPASTNFPIAWSVSNNYCGNVETVSGDDNVWKDVTSTNCDTAADECRYMDKISGLEWSEYLGQSVWGSAVQSCETLMNDGQSDWRLPTQKEIMDAYNHGITSVGNASWIPIELMDDYFWSSTTEASLSSTAWTVILGSGQVKNFTKSTNALAVFCVR